MSNIFSSSVLSNIFRTVLLRKWCFKFVITPWSKCCSLVAISKCSTVFDYRMENIHLRFLLWIS
jgi:hypothetical protein